MLRINLALSLLIILSACQQTRENESLSSENIKKGEALFSAMNCITCHSLDGKKMYGPTLYKIFGKEIEVIRNGKTYKIIADRKYLKRSILHPEYEIVNEFTKHKMPQPDISDSDADYIIDYIIGKKGKEVE